MVTKFNVSAEMADLLDGKTVSVIRHGENVLEFRMLDAVAEAGGALLLTFERTTGQYVAAET